MWFHVMSANVEKEEEREREKEKGMIFFFFNVVVGCMSGNRTGMNVQSCNRELIMNEEVFMENRVRKKKTFLSVREIQLFTNA